MMGGVLPTLFIMLLISPATFHVKKRKFSSTLLTN